GAPRRAPGCRRACCAPARAGCWWRPAPGPSSSAHLQIRLRAGAAAHAQTGRGGGDDLPVLQLEAAAVGLGRELEEDSRSNQFLKRTRRAPVQLAEPRHGLVEK